jgi:DNA-binding IclR family transcriptional regulator
MDSISGVGVVDKVVAVLRALEANGPLSLIELQDATGMPRATAHRLASALEDHGLVRREANGKFALGMGLVSMGKAASSALPLTEIARPVLDTLRTTTGESVQLYMREGEGRRCVVSLESPHGLRWIVPEGSLLPLNAGSAGHVLAGERVDKRGWIQSIGEREAGVASVSAPVVNAQGMIVAAISVSGPIERLSRKPGERHGAAVVNAAQNLAKLL